jgi:hypothetical protein
MSLLKLFDHPLPLHRNTMNEPAGDNEADSSWDALASELGLEPAPISPERPPVKASAAPRPPSTKKVEPVPEPEPEPFADTIEFIPAHVMEVELKVTSDSDTVDTLAADDIAGDDEAEAGDDEKPSEEEGAEGPAGGKRRRRRRRRKKGGAETPAVTASTADAVKAPVAAAVVPADVAEVGDEDEAAVIVGEAADEMEDDMAAGDGPAPPALAEASIEDDSTEPLPEWKVVAWTELVATLYRPQDR